MSCGFVVRSKGYLEARLKYIAKLLTNGVILQKKKKDLICEWHVEKVKFLKKFVHKS